MSKMNAEYTSDHYFAALKLIEQLNKDGLLPAFILRNILNDYADTVDLFHYKQNLNLQIIRSSP